MESSARLPVHQAAIGPKGPPRKRTARAGIPRPFWSYKDGDHHFDFWAISHDQLVAAGVRSKNIRLSGICTCCNPELFFSYRGEKVTGRFAAVIGLC